MSEVVYHVLQTGTITGRQEFFESVAISQASECLLGVIGIEQFLVRDPAPDRAATPVRGRVGVAEAFRTG